MNLPNLPAAIDTEALVLGILLTDSDALEVILGLNSDDFSLERHRRIFAAARWLHEHGQEIDRVTVAERLIDEGTLESVGGIAYQIARAGAQRRKATG